MLGKAQSNLLAAGVDEPIRAATADARYWSEENVQKAPEHGPELFVAMIVAAEQGLLFVIDGNPALDQAVRRQWGPKALVAHCQWRVRQEVLAHVPSATRAAVGADLDRIWALPPAVAAEELQGLVNRVRIEHPGAAARLQRSADATLAVARLGLPDPLQAHLRVAGPVRVALEEASRAGRAAGTGLAAVAAGLRRIRTRRLIGHEGLPVLARMLEEYAAGVGN